MDEIFRIKKVNTLVFYSSASYKGKYQPIII